jgi:hypothetical protein
MWLWSPPEIVPCRLLQTTSKLSLCHQYPPLSHLAYPGRRVFRSHCRTYHLRKRYNRLMMTLPSGSPEQKNRGKCPNSTPIRTHPVKETRLNHTPSKLNALPPYIRPNPPTRSAPIPNKSNVPSVYIRTAIRQAPVRSLRLAHGPRHGQTPESLPHPP